MHPEPAEKYEHEIRVSELTVKLWTHEASWQLHKLPALTVKTCTPLSCKFINPSAAQEREWALGRGKPNIIWFTANLFTPPPDALFNWFPVSTFKNNSSVGFVKPLKFFVKTVKSPHPNKMVNNLTNFKIFRRLVDTLFSWSAGLVSVNDFNWILW